MKRALVLIVEIDHIAEGDALGPRVNAAIRAYANAVENGIVGSRSYETIEFTGARVTAIAGSGDEA